MEMLINSQQLLWYYWNPTCSE